MAAIKEISKQRSENSGKVRAWTVPGFTIQPLILHYSPNPAKSELCIARVEGSASGKKSMSFEHLGLRAELLRAVADQGYTSPTPIQAQAIPAVLQGVDL